MNKKQIFSKNVLISLGIVLVGLGFANHLFQKQQNKIKVLNKDIALEQEKLVVANQVVDFHNKLIAVRDPYLKRPTSFSLYKLNEFASQSGIKIVSVSQEYEPAKELYEVAFYKLSLKANYHNLGKFISLLESSPELIKIEEVSIQRVQSDNSLNVKIKVSTTFIKE